MLIQEGKERKKRARRYHSSLDMTFFFFFLFANSFQMPFTTLACQMAVNL